MEIQSSQRRCTAATGRAGSTSRPQGNLPLRGFLCCDRQKVRCRCVTGNALEGRHPSLIVYTRARARGGRESVVATTARDLRFAGASPGGPGSVPAAG